jgi:hypothetical protein
MNRSLIQITNKRKAMYLTDNITGKYVMARVMRQNKMHSKNFTLKDCGDWANARRAARKWVEEMLPELPPRMSSKGRMTSKNHSGEVGVHWSPGKVPKPNGNVYECPKWIARWPGCPNKGGISWTEKQFEHEGAFVLAVLSRRLETISRDKILTTFESILGTKDYKEIVSKMQM